MPQPQLLELVKKSADYLVGHGVSNGRREAEWIFSASLGLTRMDLYTRFDMPVEPKEVERLRGLIMRRSKREPLAYVLGNQEFCGLTLAVGPGVLVPRPETEELVELILGSLPATAVRILDVGTGSGAIALALKRARPDCQIEGVDREEAALAFARRNAQALALEVAFSQGDLAQGRSGYDMVVANLPYIGEDELGDCDPELAFEPPSALFADDGGLALIRALISDAPRVLAPAGVLYLEHGWRQGQRIMGICQAAGLACEIRRDGGGKDRFAIVRRPS